MRRFPPAGPLRRCSTQVRRDDVRAGPYPLMAWVVAHAVEGVIEAVVRTDHRMLETPALRAELIALVTRYLAR